MSGIPERTKDKVAIVGFAGTKVKTPFEDSSYEFWGINELYLEFMTSPWTRWFDVHANRFWRTGVNERVTGIAHIDNLNKLNIPIYLWEKTPLVPKSEAFPKEAVVAKFGTYFTNSISWMTALAIEMGFKQIAIYGVDMAQDGEYAGQRPSCEFFLGWARGKGINIYLPPESDLLISPELYGLEETRFYCKLEARKLELTNRRQQHENALRVATEKCTHFSGRIVEAQQWWNTVKDTMPPDKQAEAQKHFTELQAELNKAQQERQEHHNAVQQLTGALGDNAYMLGLWTPKSYLELGAAKPPAPTPVEPPAEPQQAAPLVETAKPAEAPAEQTKPEPPTEPPSTEPQRGPGGGKIKHPKEAA